MLAKFVGRLGLAGLLVLSPTAGFAKTTTINDITLDVPDDYKVSNSKRGILVTSTDGEVDLWVELFSAADQPTVLEEHMSYWKKKDVDLRGDGETTTTKMEIEILSTLSFPMPRGKAILLSCIIPQTDPSVRRSGRCS